MNWTILQFGKHKGKTLPQIIFIDADWFFWAYEEKALTKNRVPNNEVELIYQRATRIKPKNGYYVKHFLYYDGTSWGFDFISIEEAEKNYKNLIGGNTFDKDYINLDDTNRTILKYIDLSFARKRKGYDKQSYKIFIKDLKVKLFNKERLNKKFIEDFFSNKDNFL
ncbi:hypothetical protein [Aliarcobacter butzleri]|uniref:hypothetical protein n=1 Tax=Aliarcobacter butzleri TaxID=28197 RepID=UPI00263D9BE9|nr:hypothetical protein [Aliarcobacter butzleri]MDN5088136.1 hypothetical protein [Aliarcobacter butzleri]